MNISGIRPYQGFYNYNIKRVQQLQQEQMAVGKAAEIKEIGSEKPEEKAAAVQAETAGTANRQDFTAADYAKQYDPDAIVNKRDKDVSLGTLDVAKAVSELDKDQVLHRYQYFVDAGKEQKAVAAAVASRGMENFQL